MNGQAVEDLVSELAKSINSGNPRTVKRKAVWSITSRSAMRFAMPSEKQVNFQIRRGTSSLTEAVTLDWTFKGTELDENDGVRLLVANKSASPKFLELRDQEILSYKNPLADSRYACNPETRIALPNGANVIMQKPFTAYTYPTSKGEVGYIRFPHYSPTNEKGERNRESMETWYENLRFVVKAMEQKTVGLIIDQDHNCGGSVKLVEDTIALFMPKEFSPMLFKLRANKATYLDIQEGLDSSPADTIDYANTRDLLKLVEKTWRETNDLLTPFTPVTGRTQIFPDREANYTKPIVILIDEMAGSGGDAFPSMMKGFGRARLFGQQTSGLGGSVEEFPALFHSRMNLRMTVTMFFKPDLSPVENNGAEPDAFYEFTRDDLMFGFQPYREAYTKYLLEQIP